MEKLEPFHNGFGLNVLVLYCNSLCHFDITPLSFSISMTIKYYFWTIFSPQLVKAGNNKVCATFISAGKFYWPLLHNAALVGSIWFCHLFLSFNVESTLQYL